MIAWYGLGVFGHRAHLCRDGKLAQLAAFSCSSRACQASSFRRREDASPDRKKARPEASDLDAEIAEANALRKKLGLKPLRQ